MSSATPESRIGRATFALGCVALSVAALAWAALASPIGFGGSGLTRVAHRIASGQTYQPDVLVSVGATFQNAAGPFCSERQRRDLLIVRARLAEDAVAAGEIDRIDRRFGDIETAALELLTCSPGHGFGWLGLFWARSQTAGFSPALIPLLRRSYELAPHELWIQVRRNVLTMAVLEALPPDLQEGALDEFVEILRANAVTQAAAILAGPAYRVRHKLLARIASLPEDLRARLSRRLRAVGSDIEVPGLPVRGSRGR